ncbi:MAG: ornithine cyclodeaminase [Alphaproteobacteria bacterium]|nr:ornithine cyclodeaminase [Alphaproteobacteria bacterium]
MTRFLDVSAVSQLLRTVGIEKAIADMAKYIASDYKRWDEFEKVSRVAHHSELGVIELMPTSDKKLFAFKYVNGHPKNIERNLSTVLACGLLAEMDTGMPVLLSEMTLLTAVRTAATSAAVAKILARKDSKVMAVIGNGAQSEFQILGFKAVLGIEEVRLYDIDPKAMAKLVRNLAHTGLRVVTAASVREAVKGADIVTTITADKAKAVILTPDMIEAGMHINAVGGDCPGKTELHRDVLKMGRVFVEYEPQTRIEGDIQQMPASFSVTELWEVLSGYASARENEGDVTIFDSVGFALADFSALRYINDTAARLNAGTTINIVPLLENPKDLYSLLSPVALPLMPKVKEGVAVQRISA